MDISEFTLHTITLEVRYEPAYLHWERAGSLWHVASQEWPGLHMAKAEPNLTAFGWKNMYEFEAHIERANVRAHFPGSNLEDEVYLIFDKFIGLVVPTLEISEFSRIGMRTIFQRSCENERDAADQFMSLGLLNSPQGKHFGISGDLAHLTFEIRWEGEQLGSSVRIATRKEEISFDPPPGIEELPAIHTEKTYLVYDVDYFTTAPTSTGQFNPLTWIPPVMQVVRRDAKDFFGG